MCSGLRLALEEDDITTCRSLLRRALARYPDFPEARALLEVARGLGFPFTLTARAENHLRGNPDVADPAMG